MASTIEKRFLESIKIMQTEYAREALQKPKDKTEFGFGQASGFYQGLLRAEQLFKEVIGEEIDES